MDQECQELIEEFSEFYQEIQTDKKKKKSFLKKIKKLKGVELDDDIVQFLFSEKYFDDNLGTQYEDQIKEFKKKFFDYMQQRELGQVETLQELFPDTSFDELSEEDKEQIADMSLMYIENGDDSNLDDISQFFTKEKYKKIQKKLKQKRKETLKDIDPIEEEEQIQDQSVSINEQDNSQVQQTSIHQQRQNKPIRSVNQSEDDLLKTLNHQLESQNTQEHCKEELLIDDKDIKDFKLVKERDEHVYNNDTYQEDNNEFKVIYSYQNNISKQRCFNIDYQHTNFYEVFNKKKTSLEVKGFYGQKEQILLKVQEFLGKEIIINNNNNNLEIMGLQVDKKFAFVFVIPQNYITQKVNENNGIKELIKILSDNCPQIVICIDDQFEIYDCKNKFVTQPLPSFQLQNNQQNEVDKFNYQRVEHQLQHEEFQQVIDSSQLFFIDVNPIEDFQEVDVTITKDQLIEIFDGELQVEVPDVLNYETCFELFEQQLEDLMISQSPLDMFKIIGYTFMNFVQDDFKEDFKQQIDDYIMEKHQYTEELSDEQKSEMSKDELKNYKRQRKKLYAEKFLRNTFQRLVLKGIIHSEILKEKQDQQIQQLELTLETCQPNYQIQDDNNLGQNITIQSQEYVGVLQYDFYEDSKFEFKNLFFVGTQKGFFTMIDTSNQQDVVISFKSKDKQLDLQIVTYIPKGSLIYPKKGEDSFFLFDNKKQKAYQINYDNEYNMEHKKLKNLYSKDLKKVRNVVYNFENQEIIFQDQKGQILTYDLQQNQVDNYQHTQSLYKNFKYDIDTDYLVAYKSNNQFDIYNQNVLIENNFQIEDIQNFNFEIRDDLIVLTTLDQQNYEVSINSLNQEAVRLKFEEIVQQDNQQGYNSILDYLYCAQKKYGKKLAYEDNDELRLIVDKQWVKKIRKYLNEIQLKNYTLSWRQDDDIQDIDVDRFQLLVETRIPITIASTENLRLVPLNKENYNQNVLMEDENYRQQNFKLIESLVNKIHFGVYESLSYLKSYSIKVISILGIKSGEKDLLINELFTSRYNHDLNKNFNGIQMSLYPQKENNKDVLYVVLNVEGFCKDKLKDEEQIRLSLVCAAISDLTIFYGSNKLGKRFESLIQQFKLLKNKLQGEKLFKGNLLLVLQNDQECKSNEDIKQSLSKKISDFVFQNNKIFKYISFQNLVHSSQPNYQLLVNQIKQTHINIVQGTQQNYQDFINDLKVTLIQVFLDDQYDMEWAQYLIKIKNAIIKIIYTSKNLIYQDYMQDQEIDLSKQRLHKKKVTLYEICQLYKNSKPPQTQPLQNKPQTKQITVMNNSPIDNANHPFNIGPIKKMKNLYLNYKNYEISGHKKFVQNFQQFMMKICEKVFEVAKQEFKSIISNEERYQKINNVFEILLEQKLTEYHLNYKICQKTCNSCNRICCRQENHSGDFESKCNCFTDHKCIELCEFEKCRKGGNICGEFDVGKHKHLCEKGNHSCQEICDAHDDCQNKCKKEKDHQMDEHDCYIKEYCQEQCSAIGCNNPCLKSKNENHEDQHQCHISTCHFKCILCDKKCAIKSHYHENKIMDNVPSKLMYKGRKVDYHICGDKHNCQELCENHGECEIVYDSIGGDNKNIIQTRMKKKCGIELKEYEKEHPEGIRHQCVIEDKLHTCSERCPQCGTYCQKQIGHQDNHSSNNHRIFNSTTQTSQSSQNMSMRNRNQQSQYKFCSQFCKEENKPMHHKVNCKQGECLKNLYSNRVKHVTTKNRINIDLVDCEIYWQQQNWDRPLL